MSKAVNMRLSDEVISIIESYVGDTFTEKFNNLVFMLNKDISARQRFLNDLNKTIEQRQLLLQRLKTFFHGVHELSNFM